MEMFLFICLVFFGVLCFYRLHQNQREIDLTLDLIEEISEILTIQRKILQEISERIKAKN
jgi:hypothetical protein